MHRTLVLISLLGLGCSLGGEASPPSLARVSVEPAELELVVGQRASLAARAWDEAGEAISEPPLRWSSTAPEVAEVDASGGVQALATGEAEIRASLGDRWAAARVKVREARLERLEVEPAVAQVEEGQSVALEARVRDELGRLHTDLPIAWASSAPEDVSVDEAGVVTGRRVEREATITATYGDLRGTAKVEVIPGPMQLEILLESQDLRVGGRVSFGAVVRDARGAEVPEAAIDWSVEDPSVAALLGDAAIEGVAPGTTTLLAKNERHDLEAAIPLRVRAAAGFHLEDPSGGLWLPGDVFELRLEVEEENGDRAPAREPLWYSEDESVARVDERGRVEIVGLGKARVGARAEGHTRSVERTVALRFREMALGQSTTCGLVPNGTVWCWGRKIVGTYGAIFAAARIPEKAAEGIVSIRHGQGACETFPNLGFLPEVCDITYGLREDGSLVAFHLGRSPKLVEAPPFERFDAADGEVCGIDGAGEVRCLEGALDTPGPVDAIFMHPLGHCLLAGGSLRCQGEGPLDVDLSAWRFAHEEGAPFPLDVSARHGCARTEAGEAICWGENEGGQVEEPASAEGIRLAPRAVGVGIRDLAVAEGVSFLLSEEEEFTHRGMGRFELGREEGAVCLEDGLEDFDAPGGIRSLHAGPGGHRCLLDGEGRPHCWGANDWGQALASNFGRNAAPAVLHPMSPFPEDDLLVRTCFANPQDPEEAACEAHACVLHDAAYLPSCTPPAGLPWCEAEE